MVARQGQAAGSHTATRTTCRTVGTISEVDFASRNPRHSARSIETALIRMFQTESKR